MIRAILIEIPQWGTMTLIEALWTFSGLALLGVCAFALPDLFRDWRATTGVLRILARAYLRRELLRLVQGALIVFIGVWASLEPPVIAGPARINLIGLILTGVLFAISAVSILQSVLDSHLRSNLRRLLEE